MKIIKPSYKILGEINGSALLQAIEAAGRTCYKSEDAITDESAPAFVHSIIERGHESVLEHQSISVRVICDRGVSHEIVRHRIASYSQESTRYCNYGKSGEVTFIRPCFWTDDSLIMKVWETQMQSAENCYLQMLKHGALPQEARSVLPNSLKTEIVMTMNLREWRHFFKLRIAPSAHPQMRQLTISMLARFQRLIPIVFDDIAEASSLAV
jgi:thymidylate synthase (FAD)